MSTRTQNNILFVAGGTGGHIFPALSVYYLLKMLKVIYILLPIREV